MKRFFFITLTVLWVNVAVAVLLFHFVEGLSLVDALYFAVTIITTVGFGDFALRESAPLMKVYSNVLMLTGPITIAIVAGIITDFVVSQRLTHFLGRGTPKMSASPL